MTEIHSNNTGMCHATNLINTWLIFGIAVFDQDTNKPGISVQPSGLAEDVGSSSFSASILDQTRTHSLLL